MKYSRSVILILAASFCFMSSSMLVTPLITGFSGSVGASAGLMGLIGGLMNLCSLFCRPVVGNMVDRLNKLRLSLAGAALMAASCLAYMLARSAAVIVAARLVNGVGFACCTISMSTWLSSLLPADRIGSGMGLYGMMNALGMAAAPAIGVAVYQRLGYRAAFSAALAFALADATLVLLVGRRERGEADKSAARTPLRIADVRVLPVALIVMLFAIPYCATQSFLVNYVEARGLELSVSLFFPVYAAALLLLRMTLKGLFDRLPFGCFLFAGALCALLSIVCLALMRSNAVMLLGAVFMAGGYGVMCSVSQSTAILIAGAGGRGLANGTYYIGLDLGMTLGPIIGGALFGALPLEWFYPALFATVPALIAVYLIWMRGKRGKI